MSTASTGGSSAGREPDARPREEDAMSFARDQTVLLVIDPANDFLSEGGAAWELTK